MHTTRSISLATVRTFRWRGNLKGLRRRRMHTSADSMISARSGFHRGRIRPLHTRARGDRRWARVAEDRSSAIGREGLMQCEIKPRGAP